jgi:hypothetical protein
MVDSSLVSAVQGWVGLGGTRQHVKVQGGRMGNASKYGFGFHPGFSI